MFYVVSYDIADDRRRTKVRKTLEDFGRRVQYSVFECNLEPDQVERLLKRLNGLLRPREDSIRVYQLCEADVKKVQVLGLGQVTKPEAFRIV